MTWRCVSAFRVGTSHIQNQTECQDNCYVGSWETPAGGEVLVAVAADGAGSASQSRVGSDLACEATKIYFTRKFSGNEVPPLSVDDAYACVDVIRRSLKAESSRRGVPVREFACTLVGIVVAQDHALAFQIGDGATIVRSHDQLVPVFWPEAGEYANQTHFLTDQDAVTHLRVTLLPAPQELAVITDGLQRLALVFATQQVHTPFFEPMFKVLRDARDIDACDALGGHLEAFLDSAAVNDRTDDDKTLVLAIRP